MNIDLHKITIEQLAENYKDENELGVTGFGGKLDIRPPYQREFIYKNEQRQAVIETIFNNYPLNVMYWAERKNGSFEIMDGQQRSISICQYLNGDFSFNGRYFSNLADDEQAKFLHYTLDIYHCNGTDSEKLKWFEIINIAGVKLTKQELLNAVTAMPSFCLI